MQTIQQLFPGVYRVGGKLATKNFAPGFRVYGEKLVSVDNVEYRYWDLFRSKLAAAIAKGLSHMPIAPCSLVLYLGASTGTTPSHVSDIVGTPRPSGDGASSPAGAEGEYGAVFCVEFAQRSMRDLLNICQPRPNMLPVFGDARMPVQYAEHLQGQKADVIYQDVAQPDQAEILIRNADMFLKEGGHAMLCIKSQSIDVRQDPKEIYRQTIAKLEAGGFETLQTLVLDPYDKDHMFWIGKKK